MNGRKIPWTHKRALAYLIYNMVYGPKRAKMKKQARREDRHYLKSLLRKEEGEL